MWSTIAVRSIIDDTVVNLNEKQKGGHKQSSSGRVRCRGKEVKEPGGYRYHVRREVVEQKKL